MISEIIKQGGFLAPLKSGQGAYLDPSRGGKHPRHSIHACSRTGFLSSCTALRHITQDKYLDANFGENTNGSDSQSSSLHLNPSIRKRRSRPQNIHTESTAACQLKFLDEQNGGLRSLSCRGPECCIPSSHIDGYYPVMRPLLTAPTPPSLYFDVIHE